MITQHILYSISCDNCGCDLEPSLGDGLQLATTQSDIEEMAEDADWTCEDSVHYCSICADLERETDED